MKYEAGRVRLAELRNQIAQSREAIRQIRTSMDPEAVRDYVFTTTRGEISLSALFGDKQDLFVIHNMGTKCAHCTLWADGFNGAYAHLSSRASFVVSSPDAPDVQHRFARERAWKFPMVSHQGSTFAKDMEYVSKSGGWIPGVSVFQRQAGGIVRVSDSGFEPGDDYCSVWHFLDLLPQGREGWQPRYTYLES